MKEELSEFVELELNHEKYQVTMAFDGRDSLELALNKIKNKGDNLNNVWFYWLYI